MTKIYKIIEDIIVENNEGLKQATVQEALSYFKYGKGDYIEINFDEGKINNLYSLRSNIKLSSGSGYLGETMASFMFGCNSQDSKPKKITKLEERKELLDKQINDTNQERLDILNTEVLCYSHQKMIILKEIRDVTEMYHVAKALRDNIDVDGLKSFVNSIETFLEKN